MENLKNSYMRGTLSSYSKNQLNQNLPARGSYQENEFSNNGLVQNLKAQSQVTGTFKSKYVHESEIEASDMSYKPKSYVEFQGSYHGQKYAETENETSFDSNMISPS